MVVVATLDAGWSRPIINQDDEYPDAVWRCLEDTHQKLHKAADKFAKDLGKNHELWQKGWTSASFGRAPGLDQASKAPLDPRLFSVRTWLPFGHADALALLAVDDIDAAHIVVGRYQKTVEEVTTAFCPLMEPYRKPSKKVLSRYKKPGSADGDDEANCGRHMFADFLDMLGGPCDRDVDRNVNQRGSLVTSEQRERPLAILSRFRLFPLLTMGRALTMTEAAYRLAAETMVEVYRDLRDRLQADQQANAGESLYQRSDLEAVRLCFLDLQDEEEIGILVTGTNYTVMMAMIAAVQRLTVERLTQCEPEAARVLFNCRSIRNVLSLKKNGAEVVGEVEAQMGDCHLFRWSRSVAAIAPHLAQPALAKSGDTSPSGRVAVETLVGIMPGHQADAEDILAGLDTASCQLSGRRSNVPWRLHMLGMSDLLLRWEAKHTQDRQGREGLIKISDAVALWPRLQKAIGASNHVTRRRDFTAWESLVSIPVPEGDLYHQRVGDRHPTKLHDLMAKLAEGSTLACLDEAEIRKVTRTAGFPATSTRPLILLSQSFKQVLSDPLIFDVVLDYVDLLEALANALIDYGGAENSTADHPSGYTRRPPLALVDQLNELVAAIDDAFELRLRRIYPEDAVRDWSLDLRSQNHQVFLAADAALKCAVAVFRKDVLGVRTDWSCTENAPETARASLGVVLKLGYHSGMSARDLKAFRLTHRRMPAKFQSSTAKSGVSSSARPNGSRLAIFNADFPHLRSVLVYADFYHESFHLIFDEAADDSRCAAILLPEDLIDLMGAEVPEGRPDVLIACREMFVHMMMLLFVFDGDRDLLLCDHFEGLSNSVAMADSPSRSQKADQKFEGPRKERIERFARLAFDAVAPLLWLEAALDGVLMKTPDAIGLCSQQKADERPMYQTVAAFCDDAWNRVDAMRHCFADFTWLFGEHGTEQRTSAERAFKSHVGMLYAHTAKYLPEMWFVARAIFAQHASRIVEESQQTPKGGSAKINPLPLIARQQTFSRDSQSSGASKTPAILTEGDAERYRELQAAVDNSIEHGWAGEHAKNGYAALPTILEAAASGSSLMPEGGAFDANLIVRRSLYHFLRLHRMRPPSVGIVKTLSRVEDGTIDHPALEQTPHAPFLIDRTAVNHFCCVPAKRRERTGREIAVLKTMWGISARNRARRLCMLVDKINGMTEETQAIGNLNI